MGTGFPGILMVCSCLLDTVSHDATDGARISPAFRISANSTKGLRNRSKCRSPCQLHSPQPSNFLRRNHTTVFVPIGINKNSFLLRVTFTRIGAQSRMVENDVPIIPNIRFHGDGSTKKYHGRNLQQINVVSSHTVYQTLDPSLLFLSICCSVFHRF